MNYCTSSIDSRLQSIEAAVASLAGMMKEVHCKICHGTVDPQDKKLQSPKDEHFSSVSTANLETRVDRLELLLFRTSLPVFECLDKKLAAIISTKDCQTYQPDHEPPPTKCIHGLADMLHPPGLADASARCLEFDMAEGDTEKESNSSHTEEDLGSLLEDPTADGELDSQSTVWPKAGEKWKFNVCQGGTAVYADKAGLERVSSIAYSAGHRDWYFREVVILESDPTHNLVKIKGTLNMHWLEGWIDVLGDNGKLVVDKTMCLRSPE